MSDDPRQDAIMATERAIVAKSVRTAQSSANTAEPDAPSVAATPEPAKEPAPAEPAAVASTETPDTPASPEASDPEKVAARKRAKQDRIDKLTRRVTERDREIGYLRAQLEASNKAAPPQATIQPAQAQRPQEPQLADFNYDQAAFDDARIEYRLNQKLAERDLQQRQQAQEREFKDRETAFTKRLAEFDKKNPGVWQEQVTTAPITTTPPMLEAIFESDIGPELGVYLANHVDEANAIARMVPHRAAFEMGRLESKLKAQPAPVTPPRNITRAPAPPPVIQSGASPGKIDWTKATMEDHEKAVREKRQQRFS